MKPMRDEEKKQYCYMFMDFMPHCKIYLRKPARIPLEDQQRRIEQYERENREEIQKNT